MKTEGYANGRRAVNLMISRIGYLHYAGIRINREALLLLNEIYSRDRLAAIASGVDVSMFPRRLKMNTRLQK
jgi:hypothetical protein